MHVPAKVERYLDRLQPKLRERILDRLDMLLLDPRNSGISKALHGEASPQRSSRLGNLRILYEIDDMIRVVDVIDIGPRGDVYKR